MEVTYETILSKSQLRLFRHGDLRSMSVDELKDYIRGMRRMEGEYRGRIRRTWTDRALVAEQELKHRDPHT